MDCLLMFHGILVCIYFPTTNFILRLRRFQTVTRLSVKCYIGLVMPMFFFSKMTGGIKKLIQLMNDKILIYPNIVDILSCDTIGCPVRKCTHRYAVKCLNKVTQYI